MEKDIRITRRNQIIEARANQLKLNQLVTAGGKPYINARLTQCPFEPDVSWNGKSGAQISEGRFTNSPSHGEEGRKNRAFLINYAARIAAKINQYVFSTEVKREPIDTAFLADATRTGMSLNDLMRKVSTLITSCGWCWIGVDRDPLSNSDGTARIRSVAEKERSGDRIYWTIWSPTEVVDWHFNRQGELKWLITEQQIYDNEDYRVNPKTQTLRTIWEAGGGTRLWIKPDKTDEIEREEQFNIPGKIVPFVLTGNPSVEPWWYDAVETIQAAMLNLESVHHESLMQSVFPQLVLPADTLNLVTEALKITGEQALEMARGEKYPILEPTEANGQSRYIMPGSDGMQLIPTELNRLRQEIFEVVGLAMRNTDARMIESAEAKAWDHLDAEAVLQERAIILEEAERKAIEISLKLDNTFKKYTPEYGKSFDVSDLKDNIKTLLELKNFELPKTGKKALQKAAMQIMDQVAGLDDKEKKEWAREIETEAEIIPPETKNP
jgi:hypothetical protein